MIALVAAPLANKPWNGGEAWTKLSWIRGLEAQGVDVWFVEELELPPDPGQYAPSLAYFDHVVEFAGLAGRAALVDPTSHRTRGVAFETLVDVAASADFLLNVSGHLTVPQVFQGPRCRVYLDLDPGFTQVWAATGQLGSRLAGHDLFLTVGELVGRPECGVPTLGLEWLPTRQCVVLDDWPVTPAPAEPLTTVASWRGAFGPIEWQGSRYGVKAHEWRRFIDLPARTGRCFDVALDIDPGDCADRDRLTAAGWTLREPGRCAGDPVAFRAFIDDSAGEVSVASGVYVGLHTGWFSDRTVRYLACGRPAVVQDTGWTDRYGSGDGLLGFTTIDEAVAAVRDLRRDPVGHAQAARALAETHFDAAVVVPEVLEYVGARS